MTNKKINLSKHIRQKAAVEQQDWNYEFRQLSKKLGEFSEAADTYFTEFPVDFNVSINKFHIINQQLQRHRDQFLSYLDETINAERLELIKAADQNFKYDLRGSSITSRASQWKTDNALIERLKSLIGQNADWRFPVIYFEPNTGELTRLVVHGDPFYVVDDFSDSIDYVLGRLPEEMTRRIHCYSKDAADDRIPDHSIGLAVVWNNWRFKRVNDIQADMRFLSKKLMPGGILFFDFNDGDTPQGAADAEEYHQSFIWQTKLARLLDDNQLEILVHQHSPTNRISYMLTQKKGERPKINLVNKLAVVEKNPRAFSELQNEETAVKEERWFRRLSKRQQEDTARRQLDAMISAEQKDREIDQTAILTAKLDRALAHLSVCIPRYGKNHDTTIRAQISIGMILVAQKKIKEATGLFQRITRAATNTTLSYDTAEDLQHLNSIILEKHIDTEE